MDAGADCNGVNDWKLTPFGAAFLKGHVGICDQLLSQRKIDINFRTENGETLVMLACSNRLNKSTVEQVDYIVNKLHGDCKLVDSNGSTALHYLAKNTLVDDANDGFANGVSDKDRELAEQYRLEMADVLFKNDCDFNLDNNSGDTALFTAIKSANIKFAKELIAKYNVTIDTRQDNDGHNLLHLLAIYKS